MGFFIMRESIGETGFLFIFIGILIELGLGLPFIVLLFYSFATHTPFSSLFTAKNVAILDITILILFCTAPPFHNLIRFILLYPWRKIIIPFFSSINDAVTDDDGLIIFMTDFRAYKSSTSSPNLTDFYTTKLAQAKADRVKGPQEKKKFQYAKEHKKQALYKIPRNIKRIIDSEGFELKTHRKEYLTFDHYRIFAEHKIIRGEETGDDWNDTIVELIYEGLGLMLEDSIMDEFYVGGELVAFQTHVIVGDTMVDGLWSCKQKARKKSLYLAGIRLNMKRALANPIVNAYCMMAGGVESISVARRYACFDDWKVDYSGDGWERVAKSFGLPGSTISWDNVGEWVNFFWYGRRTTDEKFWRVADQSDSY